MMTKVLSSPPSSPRYHRRVASRTTAKTVAQASVVRLTQRDLASGMRWSAGARTSRALAMAIATTATAPV